MKISYNGIGFKLKTDLLNRYVNCFVFIMAYGLLSSAKCPTYAPNKMLN